MRLVVRQVWLLRSPQGYKDVEPRMQQLPEDRLLILNMLKGTVPERSDDIDELWSKHSPTVAIVPPRRGATMNANAKRIEFDAKLIDVFWIVGFAAWKAIQAFTPLVVMGPWLGLPLDDMLKEDERFSKGERDFKELVTLAQKFIEDGIDEERWPEMIPRPTGSRDSLALTEHKAIYDLVLMALSFCWFHEIRHVVFIQSKSQPTSRPDEELACDAWARGFIVDKLAAHARKANQPYAGVLAKRMTAMAFAVLIIRLLTPAHAAFGDAEYPPIGDRITTVIGATGLPPESDFWTFAACLLIGIRRLDHLPLEVVPRDRKHLVEHLLDIMR